MPTLTDTDVALCSTMDEQFRCSPSPVVEITPIGTIESPYKQKFAIPRQPGLIPEAKGYLHFAPAFAHPDMLRGIDEFSHLWLIFRFHETADKGWSPLVRPPRLGGNERKGVFATRATFRPNGLGLSVVKLDGVVRRQGKLCLQLSGIDLLDGTPVIDIKPYLPYADALPNALGGFADAEPDAGMSVSFSESALDFCQQYTDHPELQLFIQKVLQQDPRPAYKKAKAHVQHYGMSLYDLNIKWTVEGQHNHVTSIHKGPASSEI